MTVIVATAGFFIVTATPQMRKQSFASKKNTARTFWAIGTAGVLISLLIIRYPWMPSVVFSSVNSLNQEQKMQL